MNIHSSEVIDRMIKELLKAKEQLESNSSHHVRESLTSVKAYCELLMDATSEQGVQSLKVSSINTGPQKKTEAVVKKVHQQNDTSSFFDDDDDGNGDSIFDF